MKKIKLSPAMEKVVGEMQDGWVLFGWLSNITDLPFLIKVKLESRDYLGVDCRKVDRQTLDALEKRKIIRWSGAGGQYILTQLGKEIEL